MPTDVPELVGRPRPSLDSKHYYPPTRVVDMSDVCRNKYGRKLLFYLLEDANCHPDIWLLLKQGLLIEPLVNVWPRVLIWHGGVYSICSLRGLELGEAQAMANLHLRSQDAEIDFELLRELILEYNPFRRESDLS